MPLKCSRYSGSESKLLEFSLSFSYWVKLLSLNCWFLQVSVLLFIIRTNIFDCLVQKVCIKIDYKDVSWKIDYCCLNAHLSESSKELVVSFYIYIRLICITTIRLSMSLFFPFKHYFLTLFFSLNSLKPQHSPLVSKNTWVKSLEHSIALFLRLGWVPCSSWNIFHYWVSSYSH